MATEQYDVSAALGNEAANAKKLVTASQNLGSAEMYKQTGAAITSANANAQLAVVEANKLAVDQANVSDLLRKMSVDSALDTTEHAYEVNSRTAEVNNELLQNRESLNAERVATAKELEQVMSKRGGLLQNPIHYMVASVRAGRLQDKLAAQSDLLVTLDGAVDENRAIANQRVINYQTTEGLRSNAIIAKTGEALTEGMAARQANVQATDAATKRTRQTALDLTPLNENMLQEKWRKRAAKAEDEKFQDPRLSYYLDLQHHGKHTGPYSKGELEGAYRAMSAFGTDQLQAFEQMYGNYARGVDSNRGGFNMTFAMRDAVATNNPRSIMLLGQIANDTTLSALTQEGINRQLPQRVAEEKRRILKSRIPTNDPLYADKVRALDAADEKTLAVNPMYKLTAQENKAAQEAAIAALQAPGNATEVYRPMIEEVQAGMTLKADGSDYNLGTVAAFTPDVLTTQVGLSPKAAQIFASPQMREAFLQVPQNPAVGIGEVTANLMRRAQALGLGGKEAAQSIALIHAGLAASRGSFKNPAAHAKFTEMGIEMTPSIKVAAPVLTTSVLSGARVTTNPSLVMDLTRADDVYNYTQRYESVYNQYQQKKAAAAKKAETDPFANNSMPGW